MGCAHHCLPGHSLLLGSLGYQPGLRNRPPRPGSLEPVFMPGRVFSSQNGSPEDTGKDVSPIFTDRCMRVQKRFRKNTNTVKMNPPLMSCPGERPIAGGVRAGAKQHWMESWPWWPLKESHPPHGYQANPTLLSSHLSSLFISSSGSQTRPLSFLDSIILCSHLPPIWSGSSTRVGPVCFDSGTCQGREVMFPGQGPQARPPTRDLHTLLQFGLHDKPEHQVLLLVSLCRSAN